MCDVVTTNLENNLTFSYKVKHLYNSAIPLLDSYQEKWKQVSQQKTCMWIFRAALFITDHEMEAVPMPMGS